MTTHRLLFLWSILPCLLLQPLCPAGKPITLAEIPQDIGFKNWYVPTIVPRNIFDTNAFLGSIGGLNLSLMNDDNIDRLISTNLNVIWTTPITPFFIAGGGLYYETEYLSLKLSKEKIAVVELFKTDKWTQYSTGIRAEAIWNTYRDLSLAGSVQWALTNDLQGSQTFKDYPVSLHKFRPLKIKVSLGGLYQLSSIVQLEVSVKCLLPFEGRFENNKQNYQLALQPDFSIYVGLKFNHIL